jgi:hypothetical protein
LRGLRAPAPHFDRWSYTLELQRGRRSSRSHSRRNGRRRKLARRLRRRHRQLRSGSPLLPCDTAAQCCEANVDEQNQADKTWEIFHGGTCSRCREPRLDKQIGYS